MLLQDEHSRLQLAAAEPDTSGHEDVHLIAEVSTRGFGGRNARIWVSRQSWNTFCRDLEELAATRSGEARLISMSPADLEICVRVHDRAGHIRVTGHVGDYFIWKDLTEVARVPFRIELDPGNLVSLVEQLRDLAPPRERASS